MKKKLVSFMLVLALITTIMPIGVFAEEPETVEVTIKAAPKTVDVKFYYGSNELNVTDGGIVGNYHQYTLCVETGTAVRYVGKDSADALEIGGDTFVANTASMSLVLIRGNVRYNGASLDLDDYSFKLKNSNNNEVAYGTPSGSSIVFTPVFLIAGKSYSGTTQLTTSAIIAEDYYLTNSGNFTVSYQTTQYSTQTTNLPIAQYKKISLTAPSDAKVKIFYQEANYVVKNMTSSVTKIIDNEDNTKTYIITGTAAHSNYQYRVSKTDKVVEAGYISDGTPVTVSFLTDKTPNTTNSSINYDNNSILLNIDDTKDTNELFLKKGASFKLRAWRGAWQIVDSITGNHMIEPDFHYKIISGSGVVDITPTNYSTKGDAYCSGNAKDNWASISAIENGTAIVAVWYDAINVSNANPGSFFGASDPSRYGVFVVNVADTDETVVWNPQTADGDWDSEFDTVYYTGESGTFIISPAGVESVTVQNVYGKTLGDVQTVVAEEDGTYNIPVKTGANIIAATTSNGTDYFVVRAKQISYTIKNTTKGTSANNSAPTIETGDDIEINLIGLDMPLPKMSGIYNPGYLGTAKIFYELNNTYIIQSAGTQYDFSSAEAGNTIKFKAAVPGENNLLGYINLSSMGDDFGNHRNTTDAGRQANTSASEKFGKFGILPSISFNVIDNGTVVEYAKGLYSLSLMGGQSSYVNAFNITNMNAQGKVTSIVKQNDATTWTKSTSNMSTYTLQVKATANSYLSKITLYYWFDGDNVKKSAKLTSGVSSTIDNPGFNNDKILNMELVVEPKDTSLGEITTYSYIVYPGGNNGTANLKYVHPVIQSISFANNNGQLITPVNPVTLTNTKYDLNISNSKTLSIAAVMLTKYKNASNMTNDKSDKVEVSLKSGGAIIGSSLTINEGNSYPTQNTSSNAIDISGADALVLKVTSYVTENAIREYEFSLHRDRGEFTAVETGKDTTKKQIRVIVENNTYTASSITKNTNSWYGTLVDRWVDLEDNSNAGTIIAKAIEDSDYTQSGANDGYITSIEGLSNGWMISLNDWIISDSCTAYTSSNGLCANDVLRVMYSTNLGKDIGSDWTSTDKSVADVQFSKGTLNTEFTKYTHSYTLTVPAGTTSLNVIPSASNKNYQVRTYVGTSQYSISSSIPIENGTIITVRCGDSTWPSMNNGLQSDAVPAQSYSFTVAVQSSTPALEDDDTITVSFRLIGSKLASKTVDLSSDATYNAEYITWIPTLSYSLDKDSTVGDLLAMVLNKEGLSYDGLNDGYISKISAPTAAGNCAESEMDNGNYSGWMYTVNGKHSGYGLIDQILHNNDIVVWHYVNDYRYEVKDWFGGTIGNANTWNKWLSAADTRPIASSNIYSSISTSNVSTQAIAINTTQTPAAATITVPFTDIATTDWFYTYVTSAYALKMVDGVDATHFEPNLTLSRAMLVTMLWKLEGKKSVSSASIFTDVEGGAWYEDPIIWAYENKIINGVDENHFSPNTNITREQAATILYNFAKYKKYNVENKNNLDQFVDSKQISSWALDALKWANASKIMVGDETGLRPTSTATRAEAATLMVNFVEKIK